jgi:hypothetical protein
MFKTNLKLCVQLVLILNTNFIVSDLIDPSYLAKYDRLYFSDKYNTKINFSNPQMYFECIEPESDCSNRGICNETRDNCICEKGYTSLVGSFKKCTYKMKSYLVALLLEVFISFGFGHLYVGNYTLFLGKFLFFFFSCYLNFCVMIFIGAINESNVSSVTYKYTKRTFFILVPIIVGWYVLDVILFATMQYKDQNGIELFW